MASSRAQFSAIRTLSFGSISGTYADVGSPLAEPSVAFRITNNTDGDLIFSLDGGDTDHLFVASGSFVLYDVRSNKAPVNQDNFAFKVGTQFAVKEVSSPTTGSIYVEVLEQV